MFSDEQTQILALGILLGIVAGLLIVECIKGLITGRIHNLGSTCFSSILHCGIYSAPEIEETQDNDGFTGALFVNGILGLAFGVLALFSVLRGLLY